MNSVFDPSIGEKILVLYEKTNSYYEAKVIKKRFDTKSKKTEYFVHYNGWNKRWDEWVRIDRILESNADNIQKHCTKYEQQQHPNNNRKGKKRTIAQVEQEKISSDNSSSSSSKEDMKNGLQENNASSNKRRKLADLNNATMDERNGDNNNENHNNNNIDVHTNNNNDNNNSHSENSTDQLTGDSNESKNNDNGNEDNKRFDQIHIHLPTELKKKLINDWENITKNHTLMKLPRENGQRVIDVLNDYYEHIKSNGRGSANQEIVRGLSDYFDQALEVTLLYKFERPLHHHITQLYPHLRMSHIYGVEHLCRLFVKLPYLLNPNELDHRTRVTLKDEIEQIIDLILENSDKYFVKTYQRPDDDYLKKVENLEHENLSSDSVK